MSVDLRAVLRASLGLPLLLLPGGRVEAQAATIRVTQVPAYGSQDNLRGRVSNVDPTAHRVATYLFLEGMGWWTKPTAAAPCTVITGDGGFEVDVTTGGVDPLATRYAVFLVPASETCPTVAGGLLPASVLPLPGDWAERSAATLRFGGQTWVRRDSPYPGGPEANCFAAGQALVDGQGQLHLSLGAGSCGAEVLLARSLGYGDYLVHTKGRLDDLDPHAVFGMFTYDPDYSPANRELDIELSRWGNAGDPNAQFVVQPWDTPGNRDRFNISLSDAENLLTFVMRWEPGKATFGAYHGHHFGDVLADIAPTDADFIRVTAFSSGVPVPGGERFRLNLWRHCDTGNAASCALGQDQEAVITYFAHRPAAHQFFTVTPCRVFDSRDAGQGGPNPLPAATQTPAGLLRRCGVPASAVAVSLNVTATAPSAGGHLRLFPLGDPLPLISTINYATNQTRANNAVVTVGDFGQIAVFSGQAAGFVHLILDINGYFE